MSKIAVNFVAQRNANEKPMQMTNELPVAFCGDAMNFYEKWPSPTVIVSDGPYGVGGFPGDLHSADGLAKWYEPHIKAWGEKSTPMTTLWFWNTEVGWATVHPVLQQHGWDYVSCCFWDKGISHVAGNVNTKTIRRLPVVTEVCVQYVKNAVFVANGREMSMKDWLRFEWERSGLPFSKSNEACGVDSAATRKYLAKDRLWYMPPAEMFEKIATYANEYGEKSGKPYFSIDGKRPISKSEWEKMRAKFYCPFGVTNVWREPQLCGKERLKIGSKSVHLNQKPLSLIKRLLEMSSDKGDVIWDPFAGLFTVAIASAELERRCFCAEKNPQVFETAQKRFHETLDDFNQSLFQQRIVV